MRYNFVIYLLSCVSWLYSNIREKVRQFIVSRRIKKKAWSIIGWLLLPNIGSWISYAAAHKQLEYNYITSWDDVLNVPSWGPPNWLLRLISMLLYTMMGYASYMVYMDCKGFTSSVVVPLTLYGVQLVLNMTWMPIFIRYYRIGLALYNLIGLALTTSACTACFYHINKKTIYLMAPQVVFTAFLTTYMYYILKLNPGDY